MKNAILFIAIALFSYNTMASSNKCASVKIDKLYSNGAMLYIIPEVIGSATTSKWKFKLNASMRPEVASLAKMGFSLNKNVTFYYYGTNDDGDMLTNVSAPSCTTNAMYNWETGAEIINITID